MAQGVQPRKTMEFLNFMKLKEVQLSFLQVGFPDILNPTLNLILTKFLLFLLSDFSTEIALLIGGKGSNKVSLKTIYDGWVSYFERIYLTYIKNGKNLDFFKIPSKLS